MYIARPPAVSAVETADYAGLAARAAEASRLMKLVANERRLLLLCRLADAGEMTVGALAGAIGLSQSALSQHLSRMRRDGLVAFRRDGQTLHYRIADPNAALFLATLKTMFCKAPAVPGSRKAS